MLDLSVLWEEGREWVSLILLENLSVDDMGTEIVFGGNAWYPTRTTIPEYAGGMGFLHLTEIKYPQACRTA